MTAVTLRVDDGVLWIGLNRPERHNIYNLAMRDALYEAFVVAAEHPDVRAAVLFGEGDNYSAGADLSQFGTAPSQDIARRVRFARDVFARLAECPRPVLAALHGYCFGSGLELALLCDYRIAADDATLALPEMRLGMIPAAGGTQSAPRVAGLGRAYGFLLTGERVTAVEALRRRLVDEVTTRDAMHARAAELAQRIAGLPQHAVAATRDAMLRGRDLPLRDGLLVEARLASMAW
jgi:enoyl-CoA hydratase/carnithine racemase